MAGQNKKFDVEENIEIDLNKQIDLTKQVVSLQCENFSLWSKIDKLETTHRIELEAKEREIEHGKWMLKELGSRWKSLKDLLCVAKDELVETRVNELLWKDDKLEAAHRVELEAKEREIERRKWMLKELDSRWKSKKDLLCMAERHVNELLSKVGKLETTHRIELDAKEIEIRGLRQHLEEVDNRWKSQKDLLCMPKEELASRQVNELLGIVDKSEATCRIELEAKETEIRGLRRHLEELDSQWKIQKVLLCMAKDDAERQVNELLSKVDKLQETHRIELEEKEREIRGLRRNLEELDNHWKRQKDLLCMAKDELAERRINELLTKVSKLENRLANSRRLIDENEQVGESSSVNGDY